MVEPGLRSRHCSLLFKATNPQRRSQRSIHSRLGRAPCDFSFFLCRRVLQVREAVVVRKPQMSLRRFLDCRAMDVWVLVMVEFFVLCCKTGVKGRALGRNGRRSQGNTGFDGKSLGTPWPKGHGCGRWQGCCSVWEGGRVSQCEEHHFGQFWSSAPQMGPESSESAWPPGRNSPHTAQVGTCAQLRQGTLSVSTNGSAGKVPLGRTLLPFTCFDGSLRAMMRPLPSRSAMESLAMQESGYWCAV